MADTQTAHTSFKPLVILVGPTAVGKTAASIGLAKALNGEIISGDSMQIFKGLDIGTAKISQSEMDGVVHHLIDIKEPWESFSAAEFKRLADEAIADIHSRGKLPIIVGGTGFYINSVLYEYHFGEAETDEAYRAQLQQYLELHGNEALWQLLLEKDPVSAERLHSNDTKRVMRALEVLHVTGISASERQNTVDRQTMRYDAVYIALNLPREILYQRINHRVEQMMAEGLEQEVRNALAQGVPQDALSMTSLGYRQMIQYFNGEISLERAVELIQRDTRHFAKRQLTWFRHDPNIQWVDKDGKTDAQIQQELLKVITDTLPLTM
ncbi:MAG: tRNA (adenosine(37)-N6)-dimethylallyltransferase MiaA [Peptococcaceae bacterium]|nr:tRNA (adenosine(37)-N6)-dimethylallyltransferase MiaA [Peptococcaceae bacterium]MBQ2995371.1 tRNA (adenosine(37)-N6)-dimethylallyltransferase MiaA [Peptococcaceae bacterium]